MADLKIPNLNKNSGNYLFKKKLSLRRKSKKKLTIESFFMLLISFFIVYINHIIPNKKNIFFSFLNNISNLTTNFMDSLSYLYDICLAIFIVLSFVFALFLILGAFFRLMKIIKRKSRQIKFK